MSVNQLQTLEKTVVPDSWEELTLQPPETGIITVPDMVHCTGVALFTKTEGGLRRAFAGHFHQSRREEGIEVFAEAVERYNSSSDLDVSRVVIMEPAISVPQPETKQATAKVELIDEETTARLFEVALGKSWPRLDIRARPYIVTEDRKWTDAGKLEVKLGQSDLITVGGQVIVPKYSGM